MGEDRCHPFSVFALSESIHQTKVSLKMHCTLPTFNILQVQSAIRHEIDLPENSGKEQRGLQIFLASDQIVFIPVRNEH